MTRSEYARRVLLAGAVAVLAALAVQGLPRLTRAGLLLFTGVLLAVVLDGFAGLVNRHTPIPRKVAVVGTVLAVLGIAGLVVWASGPRVGEEFGRLFERIPEIVSDAIAGVEETEWGATLLERIRQSPEAMPDGGEAIGGATRLFSSLAGVVTGALVVLFVGLFAAFDPPSYRDAVLDLVPEGSRRRRAADLMNETARTLKLWMKARLVSMAFVGLTTGIALTIAGIPLAFALALIAGILAFVPFVGPLLSAIPAVLIGFGEGVQTALIVAAIYTGVQAVESYAVEPLVEMRIISLPPAFVIAAQVVMGTLFGLIGVFLATPIAIVGVVLVQQLYLRDQLDQEPEPLGA